MDFDKIEANFRYSVRFSGCPLNLRKIKVVNNKKLEIKTSWNLIELYARENWIGKDVCVAVTDAPFYSQTHMSQLVRYP